MASTVTAVQIFSSATALIASGGIATLTLFDIPELQAQPASRSLPSVRWLFSRGSHIFPTAAVASSAGFLFSAYRASMSAGNILQDIIRLSNFPKNDARINGFLLAAALAFSIAPFTQLVMIPTNFALIKKNEQLGGYRSEKAARNSTVEPGLRSADDSVAGKDEGNQFSDLSGPQEMTRRESSAREDAEVCELLGKFGKLNLVRAVLIGVGGIVGLFAATA